MSVSFDRVAHLYDSTRGIPEAEQEKVADTIVSLSAATEETGFIEPGVGTGRIALPLARRGYHYTGTDISERMMGELRRKAGPDLGRLRLVRADATALPFPDASFDAGLSAHLLHLIPAWRDALSELRRVLRPGGVYLHCEQDWAEDGARAVFRRRWHDILNRHGVESGPPGARGEQILSALREEGASLRTETAAQWSLTSTVEEMARRYEARVYSTEWLMPDEVFETAIGELREWASEQYASPQTRIADQVSFEVTVARGWTGS